MSIIHVCDACGKTSGKNMNTFSYLCHIDDIVDGKLGHGYMDSEGNTVSGRSVGADLCNKCYNVVVTASVNKFKEIQKDNQEQ